MAIYDQTGAPLPGVRLTIQGATDRGAQTDVNGDFAFPGLPEGDYEISVELAKGAALDIPLSARDQ